MKNHIQNTKRCYRFTYQKQQSIDSGRSMVEMLGVLAVAGVLSVGAVSGYRYGMNRWRANETIHDIEMRLSDIKGQLAQGREASLQEWSTISSVGYKFNDLESEDDHIFLSLEKVPKGVCEIIKNDLTEYTIKVNETEDTCDEENKLTVIFSENGIVADDSSSGCVPACQSNQICYEGACTSLCQFASECGGCERCEDGMCVSKCSADEYCGDTNASAAVPHPEICRPLAYITYRVDVNGDGVKDTVVYISYDRPSGREAQTFCNRIGKKMVPVDFLIDGWSGRNGPAVAKPFLQQIFNVIGEEFLWTKDLEFLSNASAPTPTRLCSVNTKTGYVASGALSSRGYYHAFCVD